MDVGIVDAHAVQQEVKVKRTGLLKLLRERDPICYIWGKLGADEIVLGVPASTLRIALLGRTNVLFECEYQEETNSLFLDRTQDAV